MESESDSCIDSAHPNQRVALVTHEFPIAVILCRVRGLGLVPLREMIPATGMWRLVELPGVLK